MVRNRRTRVYSRLDRYRKIIIYFILKYQEKCYLCRKKFTKEDVPPRKVDTLTIHHIDHNHSNNDPSNWALSHRSCHKSYHMKLMHEEEKL